MNVTVKSLNLLKDNNDITQAVGTICIGDIFNIEGVTIKKSKEDNLYVQLPQRKYYDKVTQETKYKDVCYPTNKELREQISSIVLEKYNERLEDKMLEDEEEEESM